MFTEAYLEPRRTSSMELFLLWLSHILKTYLIRSNFFSKFEITQWNNVTTKNELRFFKLASLKVLKLLESVFFFFFSLFQTLWSKHCCKNNGVLFNS